ncbi:MAG: NAD(P)-binding domain-containing protein [Immundisolibacterales bacterium]|nr:NAD(P)-binding domain-containing protein [Immundisolibacterales bacterium]
MSAGVPHTSALVVGAGHAGLAISRHLAASSIDHLVVERGEVANSWREERWDSLRLLTPNWQTRVPGLAYDGADPDGYMDMAEVVAFLQRYARVVDPPLETRTTVESVRRNGAGYEVTTDRGVWHAATVVLATGGCNRPKVPAFVAALPDFVESVTPLDYRRPSALPDGGVLVVGASATGVQIADEVHRSGRPVTVAVGEHVRMPRTYRGKDILWWMDRTGLHDERYDEVDDIVRARRVPAPQLVGTPERLTLDLNALTDAGVRLSGRLVGFAGGRAQFSGSLRNKCNLADLKLGRLLDTIDEWIAGQGLEGEVEPVHRFAPTRVEESPPLALDLAAEGIRTVVWATGYEADHSWLHVPVLDHKGRLRHDGGVVSGSPGLYRIGLNFLRRRKSSFIHGAGDDARDLVSHLAAHLGARVPAEVA